MCRAVFYFLCCCSALVAEEVGWGRREAGVGVVHHGARALGVDHLVEEKMVVVVVGSAAEIAMIMKEGAAKVTEDTV